MEDTKEINKFLTEAMGECWSDAMCQCNRCVGMSNCCNPLYSDWKGFGKLWEWAIEQKWWSEFEAHQGLPKHWVPKKLIKPEFFAKAVFLYLKTEPPKEGE